VPTRVDGEALRRARSVRGLTQGQLARLVDVAGGERVSEWERGVRGPAVRLIPAVAAALGVSPLEFLAMPNGVDLKALRLVSGKTLRQVADRLHVSTATYLRWESGRQRAPIDRALRRSLARALGVRLTQLEAAVEATTLDSSPSGEK